jgi:hypothetical protein
MSFAASPAVSGGFLTLPLVAEEVELAEPSLWFAEVLLRWLNASGPDTRLRWAADLAPDGTVTSSIAVRGAAPDELELLAAGSDLPLTVGRVAGRGPVTALPHAVYVDLGAPIAWRSGPIRRIDGLLDRARWLARRGLPLRVELDVTAVQPRRSGVELARRADLRLPPDPSPYEPTRTSLERAQRVLGGAIFELTIRSARALSVAERLLFERALRYSLTPRACLTDAPSPVLAEEQLAEVLLGELSCATPRAEDEAPKDAGSDDVPTLAQILADVGRDEAA